MKQHNYNTTIEWTGNTGNGTENYKSYQRSYTIAIENKAIINGSSDPAFLGDKTKHNPEEFLLASISSCHMLWYLHLCAYEKIIVTSYIDSATAIMQEYENGSGKFTEVMLNPAVTITEQSKVELAKRLHQKANSMCFIANSLNFKINHNPTILIQNKQ